MIQLAFAVRGSSTILKLRISTLCKTRQPHSRGTARKMLKAIILSGSLLWRGIWEFLWAWSERSFFCLKCWRANSRWHVDNKNLDIHSCGIMTNNIMLWSCLCVLSRFAYSSCKDAMSKRKWLFTKKTTSPKYVFFFKSYFAFWWGFVIFCHWNLLQRYDAGPS